MDVHISDFDGTLTDNGHRRHLKGPEYLDKRGGDKLAMDLWLEIIGPPMAAMVRPTYIVTGRSPDLAQETNFLISRAVSDLWDKTPGVVARKYNLDVSFRPPGQDGPPNKSEKVDRMVMLANLHMRHDFKFYRPDTVHVWDDEEAIIDDLVHRWDLGAFVASSLVLNHITYDGAVRGATRTRVLQR